MGEGFALLFVELIQSFRHPLLRFLESTLPSTYVLATTLLQDSSTSMYKYISGSPFRIKISHKKWRTVMQEYKSNSLSLDWMYFFLAKRHESISITGEIFSCKCFHEKMVKKFFRLQK